MPTSTTPPRRVYRLMPTYKDFRTFVFSDAALQRIKRWQRTGLLEDLPQEVDGHWNGDPSERLTDFPSGFTGGPVLSRRIVDALTGELAPAGRFVPVRVDGEETGDYVFYLVEAVADCLDAQRSSKPKRATGHIKQSVFRPDALPCELPAFRVPELPKVVYWNGWAADRLGELVGDDLETRLVWSEDPSLKPHPDPMGF
ncbi:hypothetical protein [Streptomyces fradiae]|uniref:hypothetical protein n=1 Tax=Streptomyces fradiae TaxID=1906 RepID=UPI002941BAE4|nr:hypothetical protein [Streptomyces fradiae]WOI59648.1 hypothetical protein RYQ63_06870 [Streptomyces fradiae]